MRPFRKTDGFYLSKSSEYFQLIEIGYMSDPIKVMSLLERRNHRWGDKNLMELSHIGHLRSFIASKQSITQLGV